MNTIKKRKRLNLEPPIIAENYFEDMAADGYYICKISPLYFYFFEAEPRKMDYRIEKNAGQIPAEKWNEYKEKGWDYVCASGDYYLFSAEKGTAEEIYSEQNEKIEYWKKKYKNALGIALFSVVFILYFVWLNFRTIMTEVHDFRDTYLLIVSVLTIICTVITFLREISNYLIVRRILNKVKNLEDDYREIDWRKSLKFGFVYEVLIVIILVLLIAAVFVLF